MSDKLLNLDDVGADEEKAIVLGGKEYVMKSMTVEDFIKLNRAEEELKKKGEDQITLADQFEILVETVGYAFPDMSEDMLKGLRLDQLNAIFEFTRAEVGEEAEQAEGK